MKKICIFIGVLVLSILFYLFVYNAGLQVGWWPRTELSEILNNVESMSEGQLWSLQEHFKCDDLPLFRDDVPKEFLPLYDTCYVINKEWSKKRKYRKLNNAVEGLERLEQYKLGQE